MSFLIPLGSLVGSAVAAASACPASAPLSCQSSGTVQNTCCTEVQGQVLQVQFWDSSPATGPVNSWTIHGLWSVLMVIVGSRHHTDHVCRPDNCDGTYKSTCDSSRAYTDISCTLQDRGATDILDYMETYWKDYQGNDESFW